MSRQCYCMGWKPGELQKPSSRRYKCLLTIVYTKYFRSIGQTLSTTINCGREQTVEEEMRKKRWKWIGHTLRNAPNCITRKAFNWNPQSEKRIGRPKKILHREMEIDTRRTKKNCMELEMKAEVRVGWRMVVGGLSCIGSNRCK
uniref:Ovule protein n=1 Tax=Schistosoma curassoni TaxID=6186 RepID=A0A183JXX2_9TREM